jgi:alkaline phosphatase
MTAMSTGYKAREGMLSVDHATARGECNAGAIDSKKVKTILEYDTEMGKTTGIVSTARITHAAPVALYAHTAVRDWEADANLPTMDVNTGAPCRGSTSAVKDIARQLIEASPNLKSSLRVAPGGGRTYLLPAKVAGADYFDPEYPTVKGRRLDGRNLAQEWVSTRSACGDASYVWNKTQFDAFDTVSNNDLLGPFEPSHVLYEAGKAVDPAGEPTLTQMTDMALRTMLKDHHRGFFLHVEGGRIDYAHHAGNASRALGETIEFSNAIRKTFEMLEATGKMDEALTIATADHCHVFTIAGYPSRGNNILGLVRGVPAKDGNALGNSPD